MIISFNLLINRILYKKYVWRIPILSSILIIFTRLISLFSFNLYISHVLTLLCILLLVIINLIFCFKILEDVFLSGSNFKSEVIMFGIFNLNILKQFFLKFFTMLLFFNVIFMFLFIMRWSFNFRELIILNLTSLIFLIFKLLGDLMSVKRLNLLVLLVPLSFYISFYVIPNMYYILNGDLKYVLTYSFIYYIFYIMLSTIFFVNLWRKECF